MTNNNAIATTKMNTGAPPLMAKLSLFPVSKPSASYIERTNGRETVRITPSRPEEWVYGKTPRLIFLYVQSMIRMNEVCRFFVCTSDNRITKICYDIVMGTAEKLEATDIRPGRPRLGGYDEATAIINFKVPASWKTAMAQEAKSRNQNLSDYLREVTSLGYSAMHAGE